MDYDLCRLIDLICVRFGNSTQKMIEISRNVLI